MASELLLSMPQLMAPLKINGLQANPGIEGPVVSCPQMREGE